MCSMLSTVVVRTRSNPVVIRPFHLFRVQAGELPGHGDDRDVDVRKMSVGVRRMTTGLKMRMRSARTMKVVGTVERASLTTHIVCPAHRVSTRHEASVPSKGGRILVLPVLEGCRPVSGSAGRGRLANSCGERLSRRHRAGPSGSAGQSGSVAGRHLSDNVLIVAVSGLLPSRSGDATRPAWSRVTIARTKRVGDDARDQERTTPRDS